MSFQDSNIEFLNKRFDISGIIGRGSSSDVYKAYDRKLNKEVAVKVLNEKSSQNINVVSRFIKESKAFASLKCKNVINIYDVVYEMSSGERPYIVMECATEKTLRNSIKEYGSDFPIDKCISYSLQIAQALKFVHDKNIIHRDIKPQNVIFFDNDLLKLTDFGIAIFDDDDSSYRNTVSGTPLYMSPEQITHKDIDKRTDIYSLGITMYEMVCGKVPFLIDNIQELYGSHSYVSPESPCDINPKCPIGLSQIIEKCLRKNREERFDDCESLIKALNLIKSDKTYCFNYSYPEDDLNEEEALPADTDINNFIPEKTSDDSRKTLYKKEKSTKNTSYSFVAYASIPVFIFVFLIICSVFLRSFILSGSNSGEVYVPDNYVGMIYSENVRESIEESGMKISVIKRYDSSFSNGEIIMQNPKADEKTVFRDGNAIMTLTVSYLDTEVIIDDYSGMKVNDAASELSDIGFNVLIREVSDSSEEGTVLYTEPSANQKVQPGSDVILFVSSGMSVDYSYVPNCVGLSSNEAERILSGCGLSLGEISYSYSSDHPIGQIISQNRIFGEKAVSSITKIDVTVSLGKKS